VNSTTAAPPPWAPPHSIFCQYDRPASYSLKQLAGAETTFPSLGQIIGASIMPLRKLTGGEKLLLRSVFGPTLPYDDQDIDRNDKEYGGRTNSITFAVVPHMAPTIWALDYSAGTVSDGDKWIFIHEMGHVWNWYHGGSNMRSAIWIGIKDLFSGDSYEDAYNYDLSESTNLRSYNIEQQASIIADYWYVVNGHSPKHNIGTRKTLADYQLFIDRVQTSGPPADQTANVKYANRSDSRPL
jgi:hypothetical protein